jgi:very-short-patch-repair endonuclease
MSSNTPIGIFDSGFGGLTPLLTAPISPSDAEGEVTIPLHNGEGKGRGRAKQQPKGSTGLIRLQKVKNDKLVLAKYFRQHMTFGEKCFWNMVRKNQVNGFRFRRQQVIHGFVADFYCNQINLVVEIDGGIHEQQKDYDKLRTQIINQHGIQVIRFTNEEVVNKSDLVLAKLKEFVKTK